MKWMTWLKEHIVRYIDVSFFINKIAIFIFSGLISVAPIFFVGLGEILEEVENVATSDAFTDTGMITNVTVNASNLFVYIKSSTDFVYALVSLSTIVLADVLGSKKDEGSFKFVLGLLHILTVVFGILIYAYYKTHKVDADSVESLNWICFLVVSVLSFYHILN